MTSLLVLISISSIVINNGITNNICKKELKTDNKVNSFNVIVYIVCMLLFGVSLLGKSISLYTFILGVIFGVVTALANLYKMYAL